MKVIGITGGVASGKSAVAGLFRELGAAVLDADRAGHEVLRQPEVPVLLRQRWGDEVVDPSGEIRRDKVAAIVFGDGPRADAELEFLESVSHPRIDALLHEQIQELQQAGGVDVVVLDAALLFEANWHRHCDATVFVDAPVAVRQQRALGRGWSLTQFEQRQAVQLPVDQKQAEADYKIDNAATLADARQQVGNVWNAVLTQSN